jgi:hypothetical protein
MVAQFIAVHAVTAASSLGAQVSARVSLYIRSANAIKISRMRRFLRAAKRRMQLERDRIRCSMHFFLDFISDAPYI